MKNRGLTRDRKKIDANPRVKNREKFRKAQIRVKGQVPNEVCIVCMSSSSAHISGSREGAKLSMH